MIYSNKISVIYVSCPFRGKKELQQRVSPIRNGSNGIRENYTMLDVWKLMYESLCMMYESLYYVGCMGSPDTGWPW